MGSQAGNPTDPPAACAAIARCSLCKLRYEGQKPAVALCGACCHVLADRSLQMSLRHMLRLTQVNKSNYRIADSNCDTVQPRRKATCFAGKKFTVQGYNNVK